MAKRFFNNAGLYIKREKNALKEDCWFFGFPGGQHSCVITQNEKARFLHKMEQACRLMEADFHRDEKPKRPKHGPKYAALGPGGRGRRA